VITSRGSEGNETHLLRSELCSRLWVQPLHFLVYEYSSLFLCGELTPEVCPSILDTPYINQAISANAMRCSLAYRPDLKTRQLYMRGYDLWGCPLAST
jgi:hypothetical protein